MVGVGLLATGIVTYQTAGKAQCAKMELNLSKFMAAPITEIDKLNKNPNDMKTKMELLVMKTQADFCKVLESLEHEDHKFKVDRWQRKEGGGGVTCVLQDGVVRTCFNEHYLF